jgi:dihydropteroate synthase
VSTRFLDVVRRACTEKGAAVMAVVNTTPDSFFDGGEHLSPEAAEARVAQAVAEGADIIDVGGESSRPGARPVAPEEQLRRIEPAVRAAVAAGMVVSIDTTSARVAERALDWGAVCVNDVSCLADVELARVTAAADSCLILMHSRETLGAMAGYSQYPEDGYGDLLEDVSTQWLRARDRAVHGGLEAHRILCDPGLGFSKNARQSFDLLRQLKRLQEKVQAVIVLGPSRKSFLTHVDPVPPHQRLGGTIAACLFAVECGAQILRVHDVLDVRQALLVCRALRG